MTLEHLLSWILAVFHQHGAHHAAVGAVSHHLGWVTSKHWIVKICRVGSPGCHF